MNAKDETKSSIPDQRSGRIAISQFRRVSIDPVIKIGDLLTSASLLIALVSLLIAWSHDRNVRNREQADRVRRAAAATLAKLERSEELVLWYYDEVQPLFVETSTMLEDSQSISDSRDHLWKELNVARTRTLNRIHEEQIEAAYVELYGYYPAAYDIVTDAVTGLRSKEQVVFSDFLLESQRKVLSFSAEDSNHPVPTYQPALLGNLLRNSASLHQERLRHETETLLRRPHEFILAIIQSSDNEILRRAGDR